MNSRPRILFTGGGSGGHLFPGIAVAEELIRRASACECTFAASEREINGQILTNTGFDNVALPMAPAPHRLRDVPRFATGFASSLRAALRLLRSSRPDAVVGLGGFASVPAGFAAWWLGVPLILLEQNVVPGRATSFLARFTDELCLSFAETRGFLKTRRKTTVTGNPVRDSVLERYPRDRSRSLVHTADGRPTLLILGGSQGAAGVNSMALSAISRLHDQFAGWRIVHQAGERDAARVRAGYRQLGIAAEVAAFFADLPDQYSNAQLVISRAGATTLAELACRGLPAILIPYPQSAKNHQQRNAEHFTRAGASVVVTEGSRAADNLEAALHTLLRSNDRRRAMSIAMRRLARPDAAAAVADIVLRRCRGTSAASELGEKIAA